MKNRLNKLIATLGSVALLLLLIILCIQAVGLNAGLYGALQRRLDVADYVGITQDELDDVTKVFIDYTVDNQDDLDVFINYDNQVQQMFNEREITHMVDVKKLYLASEKLTWWLGAIALLAFAYLWFAKKRAIIVNTHTRVSLGFLFVCIALGIYFALDFNGFWTNVHLLLFTNDLWLLNPVTDRMIRMFPLEFFLSLSAVVLAVFVASYVLLWITAGISSKKIGKSA